MPTYEESVAAISDSLPPATDYLTYLTILELHLSPDILPRLNTILQDVDLVQNIGWDLVHLLLPVPGSEECLTTIARLGNPREVVLKICEALQILDSEEELDGEVDEEAEEETAKDDTREPTGIEKFCLLVQLLAIVHPRIKTKYPSRFLSTSLMAVLSTFRPTHQATLAVISFAHTISGKKRPSLPGRASSLNIPVKAKSDSESSAPDPEAQDEEAGEAAIQTKLLQSFVTHVLEEYVNANPLEWSARLQESLNPKMTVTGRRSVGDSYKEDPALVIRDTIVGRLIALLRDLQLSDHKTLLAAIFKTDSSSSSENAEVDPEEENYPTSPNSIPLSQAGSLFILTWQMFSSVVFASTTATAPSTLSIFPDHALLVNQFIGSPENATSIPPQGLIDAILSIGLYLESTNSFVSGPLSDTSFLTHLQSLSLLSSSLPSPTLRYAAHTLTSLILHAHPADRVRLSFISDTLEHCPYDTLRASAVGWLKDELITANTRHTTNAFASPTALTAVQPYIFPTREKDEELEPETLPFHMAVVNFLYFVAGSQYEHLIPPGMLSVVEETYLGPLRAAVAAIDGDEMEVVLLGERIAAATTQVERAEGVKDVGLGLSEVKVSST